VGALAFWTPISKRLLGTAATAESWVCEYDCVDRDYRGRAGRDNSINDVNRDTHLSIVPQSLESEMVHDLRLFSKAPSPRADGAAGHAYFSLPLIHLKA
jgi:hypothetical protein